MNILVAENIGTNSYITSLVEAYKKAGHQVVCGLHNFFYSNFPFDLVHLHWPERIYDWHPFNTFKNDERINIIEERLNYFRKNGAIIIQTIHNLKPHIKGAEEFEKKVFNLIIRNADILNHHCERSFQLLSDIYPVAKEKMNIKNHHGDFLLDYKKISKTDARNYLGISEKKFVILNFGNQIKYKGGEFIFSVFKKLPIREKFLLTAGNFRFGGYSKLNSIMKNSLNKIKEKRIFSNRKYIYRVMSPEELQYIFSASDIVFLAHRGSLTSGILPMAATFSKPVVFPDIGCFTEQMNNWIYENYKPDNKSSAAEAIMLMFKKIKESKNESFDNSKWLENNSWEKHVYKILDSIKKINIYSKINSQQR